MKDETDFLVLTASAPVFASMITLINEKRIQAGKSRVGFLNPTLYANPKVMNDIKNGSNPGCGTAGFEAAPGWDPLTGMSSLILLCVFVQHVLTLCEKSRSRHAKLSEDGAALHESALIDNHDLMTDREEASHGAGDLVMDT